ncbi:glycosyltransferase [Nafulsella turpanensis]|uniref:glycosyltransferase n=1 Tax=Nafulsella turpanensis TaxID=1265690 RepID=UPI0003449048|nr:glycosyltransferase [Nafulsella turpanensis]
MKISYVTIGNALDIHNWSGLEYYIAKALEDHVGEVNYIGNLTIKKKLGLRQKQVLYRLIGQRYDAVRTPFFARQCSQQVKSLLKPDTDIIFSPGSVATALLETSKPKVIYSDATFAGLLNFYIYDFCSDTIKKGHYLEQRALESASLAIYSSDYAAQSALQNYKVDAGKIKVVPFGANIKHNFSFADIKAIVRSRSRKECNLLFLGVDWERKGGELAVKVAGKLNKLGIKTNLHVVGIKNLPVKDLPNFVLNHGFISKSTKEGEVKIQNLMAQCHFLLLPTKAEAYGLVFCEANSFALPSITTNVGGIPTIIKNGINGRMFDLSDTEEVYGNYIASAFSNPKEYEQLAFSSYNEYKTRLNWQVAGESISRLLKEI